MSDRTTTITVHPTLFELLSIALTGRLDARKAVVEWLSDRITTRLGKVPKGTHGFIGKYVTDTIVSKIADPKLWAEYEKLS